jgi:predicted ATPase/DNA-binding CsgD family transcriptional regulator
MIDQTKQRLGNYRLLHILGKGSFADVYLGKHIYLKHEVAIKVHDGRMDEEALEHFLEKVGHWRKLSHPHIIRILDVGIQDDVPYFIMEYAPGGTLRERYSQGKRLPLPTIISYVKALASALDYAHAHQCIHRDLKPENVLLGENDHLLLSDFVVALPLFQSDSMSPQSIGGTLAYMAPEQIRGQPCTASDQYALAVMVYEWITGNRPFSGSAAELCGQHLFVSPLPLTRQVPDLPLAVEHVINKALSKDFMARFESVSGFAALLELACRGEEISLQSSVEDRSGEIIAERAPSLEPAKKTFYNLPARVSTLIGRDRELAAACVLLSRSEVRLLTLTGPGGIGKTALALACVSEILPAFRDGTCFVDLASISDPDGVLPTLLQTLGIKEQRDLPLIASLKQVLLDKHLLLVLDNFEQVLDAAPLLLDLLQSCPEIKMLVTSRTVLHVQGEQIFPVPPLAVPDPRQTEEAALLANPSIALFVVRARAHKQDFQITPANTSPLIKLCRELDGLPLAIELAAARISHLSPQQLLRRFTRRLDLLARPSNTVPKRQQTIRNTIQWSYDLLTKPEQLLLARLSVFVGGCTLVDVEALYERLNEDPLWVMDGIASLTSKSLIFQREPNQEPRLYQLEVIREFAKERLQAEGLEDQTREAHTQHYASLAPIPEPAQLGLAQGEWLEFLKREYQNLSAALHFFVEKQKMEQALQLTVGMVGIWFVNGYGNQGQEEMERILKQDLSNQGPILHTMALTLLGRICVYNNDLEQAVHWYRQSLSLSLLLEDKRFLGLAIGGLAYAEAEIGNYAEVDALLTEKLPLLHQTSEPAVFTRAQMAFCLLWLYRGQIDKAKALAQEGLQFTRATSGQQWLLACALYALGWIDYLQENFVTAYVFGKESVEIFRRLSFPIFALEALCIFAYETAALGDLSTAQKLLEEHQTLSQEAGDTAEIARSLCGLGYVTIQRDELAKARLLFGESIQTLLQMRRLSTRFTHILASSLEGLAYIAITQEQPMRASWLLGTADALRQGKEDTNPLGKEAPFWEHTRMEAANILGSDLFNRTFQEGKGMTVVQALAAQEPEEPTSTQPSPLPLESLEGDGVTSTTSSQPASQKKASLPSGESLTRRETEVLRLLAQGFSNAEIAERLVISVVTVNSYLRSIYSKMGVSSRTRATRYALDHHLI